MQYESLLPFYHLIWRHWRERRYQMFQQFMAAQPIKLLLDVGGSPSDWFGRVSTVEEVDCLNLGEPLAIIPSDNSPNIRALQGDGRMLNYRDESYEVVYSNSVIEHVGCWEDQIAFANEVRRVGRKLWIQTPAYECPVEPHYLGLFIHWLPCAWRLYAARWFTLVGLTNAAGIEGLQSIMNSTRLLTKNEFSYLFPDCEIHTERLFLVFRKSYIAIRR